jgi:hypothetical protein
MRLNDRISRLEEAAGLGPFNQVPLLVIFNDGAPAEEIARLEAQALKERFGEPVAPLGVDILWLKMVLVTPSCPLLLPDVRGVAHAE